MLTITDETTIRHVVTGRILPGTYPPPLDGLDYCRRFDPHTIRVRYTREHYLADWTIFDLAISGPIIKANGQLGVTEEFLTLRPDATPYSSRDLPSIEWVSQFARDNTPPTCMADSTSNTGRTTRYAYPYIYALGIENGSTPDWCEHMAAKAMEDEAPHDAYRWQPWDQLLRSGAAKPVEEFKKDGRAYLVYGSGDTVTGVWWLARSIENADLAARLHHYAANLRAGRDPRHGL